MTDANTKTAITKLERDYAEYKENFERWKVENASFAGQPDYNAYVESFLGWERNTLDQIKELSMVRQPIVPQPQLPTVSLDTQLNETLQQTSTQEFIMSFIMMTQKDPTFLKRAFEVVSHETKLTHEQTSSYIPESGHNRFQAPYHFAATSNYQQKPPHPSLQNFSQGYSPNIKSIGDMIQCGVIPEGWAVDPAIKKATKPHLPHREYGRPFNLPFKDFSQS